MGYFGINRHFHWFWTFLLFRCKWIINKNLCLSPLWLSFLSNQLSMLSYFITEENGAEKNNNARNQQQQKITTAVVNLVKKYTSKLHWQKSFNTKLTYKDSCSDFFTRENTLFTLSLPQPIMTVPTRIYKSLKYTICATTIWALLLAYNLPARCSHLYIKLELRSNVEAKTK